MLQRVYKTKSGFDLRLEARLKNAKLVNARESLGLSAPQAAKKLGISYSSYNRYEALLGLPLPEVQKKICKFYRKRGVFLLEEDVFPEELRHVKFPKKYVAERTIQRAQLLSLSYIDQRQLPSSESEAEHEANKAELMQHIDEALYSLTIKEAEVLRLRYFKGGDLLPYEQIGERIGGVSIERARQIHNEALRKLKHLLAAEIKLYKI